MAKQIKVGVIGGGNISPQYLRNLPKFSILKVEAIADMLPERATSRAAEFNVARTLTPDELLADPEIDIVLNITPPNGHAAVALAAIAAGKSVYNEKPLAISREDGQKIIDAAATRGVRVGCAPDTFLGGGLQTCRKLIDDGAIGVPVAATAFMLSHGPESWHPNPDFYYQPGGGPMFDMGPYYLTALIHLLGPVGRVTGATRRSFPERVATSQMHNGRHIPVEVQTHVAGLLEFEQGAVGTIITSFDVWSNSLPRIEIYGSEGTMSVPDPNDFKGPVLIRHSNENDWTDVPLTHSADVGRGIGVADMAYGLTSGRPHRASGALGFHVLDLMHAFHDAATQGRHITLTSQCAQPAPLPVGLPVGELDA